MSRLAAWSALVTLASALPTAAAPAPALSAVPVPLPFGVADPAGKVGFVANDKDGIDALKLETGALLWDTKEAVRPLVVLGDRLVAQAPGKANSLRIVVLDAATGKRLLASGAVTFPDWVAVVPELGRSFASSARVEKGDLLLKWQARAFYAGGAAPTQEILEAAKKEASGVARVNLETGKVEMLDADKAPADDSAKLPAELRKIKSLQYWTGSDWKTTPLVNGDTVSALEVKDLGDGKAVLKLRRWDRGTAKEMDTVELLKGKSLWPMIAPDGRHVLVHQALVKEQLPPGDYAWWVFALDTGKQVAKFPFEAGMTDVTVLGPRAYFVAAGPSKGRPGFGVMEQPRLLKALDLASGKVLWEHALPTLRITPPPP